MSETEPREHERDGIAYYPVARLLDNLRVEIYAAAAAGMTAHLKRLGYRAVFLREFGLGVVWAYRDPSLPVVDEEFSDQGDT